ncbi:MAG TPA: EsaB/YukD family protein [Anaerolineae bacterium]|nr:EsaB/YukD family protein [Anaerolineae bacterium]
MSDRAIVTVKVQGEARVRDLEVPTDIAASRLLELITEALRLKVDAGGQTIDFSLDAHPPGRTLLPDETLASAGVWDGAWLVLRPHHPRAPLPAPDPPAAAPSDETVPVFQFKPLDLGPSAAQPGTEPLQPPHPVGDGPPASFVWKQID